MLSLIEKSIGRKDYRALEVWKSERCVCRWIVQVATTFRKSECDIVAHAERQLTAVQKRARAYARANGQSQHHLHNVEQLNQFAAVSTT